MSNDADVSLESDDLDRDLEKAAPPPPVVVVQYKKRGIPSWIAFPLIVAIPILSILAYHRLVVEPYRSRAAEAERVLETWIKTTRPGDVSSVQRSTSSAAEGATGLDAVPASVASLSHEKSAAVAAVGVAPPAAQSPQLPSSSSAVPPSSAPGTASPSTSVAKAPTPPAFTPPSGATGSPAAAVGMGAAILAAAQATDSPSNADGGQLPPAQGVGSAAGDPNANPQRSTATRKAPPATAALAMLEQAENGAVSAPAASPMDDPKDRSPDSPGGSRIGGVHTRSAGIPADDAIDQPAGSKAATRQDETRANAAGRQGTAGFEPLPTREESLRAIAEEAARKQTEIADSRLDRKAEVEALRAEDRVKFRNELREVLRVHGNKAGDEIDRLARRYGYEASSTAYDKALQIWKFGRMSQQAKVRLIRSLDLPESVILDFLSDNQHGRVRTRAGPRNENEVRVRAARQLLAYELPSQPAAARPAPSSRPATDAAEHGKAAAAPDGVPR
jgi:hypothetical protein